MRDFDMPASICPICGYETDAAMNTTGNDRPEPGDITICIDCASLNVFGDDLRVREPTDKELAEMACDPRIKRALAALAEVNRERKSHG